MTQAGTFDVTTFKAGQLDDWESTAAGWDRWHDVLEGETAGRVQTAKLLELAGVGPGDVVLDVATGCGEPGLSAARAVGPDGRAVLSDISPAMLEHARRRAERAGIDNVEFVPVDAEELDLEDAAFDAVLSRHGLQFLVDVVGTLRRLHRSLAPHGRLAAIVWGPPPTVGFSVAVPVILEELHLPPPPPDRPGIFALADAQRLAGLVSDAGFGDVETGTLTVVYEAESPEAWTQLIRDISPPIAKLVATQRSDVQERVWDRVTEAWTPFTDPDGRVRIDCQAIWVAGTR